MKERRITGYKSRRKNWSERRS